MMIQRILYIIALFLMPALSQAQNEVAPLKKVEWSVNVFGNPETNFSKNTKYATNSGYQLKYIIYPMSHKNTRFGLGFGFERLNTSMIDTFSIHENRIPLLASVKFSSRENELFYAKLELGSAVVFDSEKHLNNGNKETNHRSDVGAPILISGSIGMTLIHRPDKYNIGIELGYAYKQYGYKQVTEYNANAVVFGIFAALP